MKIALFTDGIYPYVIGGMQKHSFYLAKYFARNNVQVDLYHTNKSSYDITLLEFFSEEEKSCIRSFVVDFPTGDKFPGHYIRASYKYSCSLFDIFKTNLAGVDFVYAKGFSAWKLLEEKSKGFKCPPVGINFHGYEMFQKAPGLRSWLEQRLLLRKPVLFALAHADFLFSYGGKITEIIKGLVKDHSRIIVLPAGIDPSWIADVNEKPNIPLRFVFVGRYERRKGIFELNKVLAEIEKDHSFEFVFIGPIPEAKRIISPKIRYYGSIGDELKIREILSGCDVLVCPSHSEGMPNVILEGMARGLAIIASDVGAVSGLVSGNGILIRPANVQDLKSAMLHFLQMDAQQLIACRNVSVVKIKKEFLWDTIIEKTIKSIRSVIKG